MIQQFIGRTAELAFLEERYSSKKAEFIVIYGRRRIGKTELIHRFTSGKPHVYFQCEKSEMNVMLEEFQQRVAKSLGNDIFGRLRISSWYELFEELVNRIPGWDGTQGEAGGEVRGGSGGEAPEQSQKFIIVLDEFPYLAEVDNSITSVFQKIWNEILSRAQIMLILCGSSIGMMEKEVLSARSPLFGRRTGQIFLRALSPFEIGKFLPNYSFKDIAMVYGVCDGIPAYIEKFDPELSFDENLREKVLNKNEYLYAEGEFLLKSEFREYRKYFLILSIISRGKRSFNEIINTSGLDKGLVSKYLSNLQALHLIEVDHPITTRTAKARKARYRISDHFLKFWFRFIYSNRHEIEEYGHIEFEDIQIDFSSYMGPVFEIICCEYLRCEMGRKYPNIGAWWNRRGDEIDVVAIDKSYNHAVIGECKWTKRKMGVEVFSELQEKQLLLKMENSFDSTRYILFSRAGFTDKLANEAALRDDLTLVGPREFENALINKC